ncbi:hypothetical protein B0H13DRAFT_1856070 [Mycena leptocephala]|nr:hypothetical protein B0H13DRAFT_1856070 [Mycena leptocephala]
MPVVESDGRCMVSRANDRVATSCRDGTAMLWSVAEDCIGVFNDHTRHVEALKFDPTGRWIATGGSVALQIRYRENGIGRQHKTRLLERALTPKGLGGLSPGCLYKRPSSASTLVPFGTRIIGSNATWPVAGSFTQSELCSCVEFMYPGPGGLSTASAVSC